MRVTATIWDEDDMPLSIEGWVHRERRGSRDKYGAALELDNPAEMEVIEALDPQGIPRELSQNQRAEAEAALWEEYSA